jgi:hypothetical protein
MNRSVVTKLSSLKPGTYSVVVKVLAERDTRKPSVEQVIRKIYREKADNTKLSHVGLSYNVAHAKEAEHPKRHMKIRIEEGKKRRRKREREDREKFKQIGLSKMSFDFPLGQNFQNFQKTVRNDITNNIPR